MEANKSRWTVYAAATVCLTLSGGVLAAQLGSAPGKEFAPLSTPEGITVQPLGRAQGYALDRQTAAKLPRLQIAFTNGEGMTLYTSDADSAGKSVCVDECAKTWIPAAAPKAPKLVEGWSVIPRADGTPQWAYKNKPLYTYVGDVDIGSINGNSPARFGRGPLIGPRGAVSKSIPKDKPMPQGWHVAMMFPIAEEVLPGGFSIREVEDAMALVITQDESGKTLYAFDGDPQKAEKACSTVSCRDLWLPVRAPTAAMPYGEFNVALRTDGIEQWTYRGRALFTSALDLGFGEANAMNVDKRWQVAAVLRNYLPSNVTIQVSHKLGKVMATENGQTLYRRNGYIFQSGGGHSYRRGDPIRPAVGRDLGGNPRCDTDCDKWHPFLAPVGTQPHGDWTTIVRDDGAKQWVHRGYALWTYDGDKEPGDINGNDMYDFKINHDPTKVLDIGTPADGGWALTWIAAYP